MSDSDIRNNIKKILSGSSFEEIEVLRKELQLTGQTAEKTKRLRKALDIFNDRHQLSVGQLVEWKPIMKNRKKPAEGEPAIIVAVLDEPLFDNDPKYSGASTNYFREPLDLVLGLLDETGGFDIYHFDSRRFRPYSANSPETTDK